MRKLPEKEPRFKAEITALMSLIFILMLSVVGALLESVSIQVTRDRKRADTALALESVFAEYHREMLDTYDVFVRFGCSEEVLNNRLSYYGAERMEHHIEQQELLTDHNGMPFYRAAVTYAKDLLGMEGIGSVGNYDFAGDIKDIEKKEHHIGEKLEGALEEGGESLPEENNPIQSVNKLKNSSLLSLVLAEPETLSNRTITPATLPTGRKLRSGNWEKTISQGGTDKLFFVAYLTEHFSDFTTEKEKNGLLYEQEYLLAGQESDRENLEAVCKQLLKIRMAINYVYLLTDTAKQAEAEAMAAGLCTLLTVPGITELVKQGILLSWVYGESIVDLRVLLQGKKVATIKTADTWQLQLANLVSLGTENEVAGEKESATGFSYQDYVKGFLLLEDRETLCMRSLDLIEHNLHIKTDQCMTKVKLRSKLELRRGIEDTFETVHQYN